MIKFKDFFSKKILPITILTIVCLVSLLISLIFFTLSKDTSRRIFIFPSADNGEFIVEYRNLNKNPVQGSVNFYIDELLLGSTVERTKTLFTPGTKVLSCFQRDHILYLNLSSDLINMGEGVIDIKSGMNLLEKNIKKNFPKIHEIEIFVNGKMAFENQN